MQLKTLLNPNFFELCACHIQFFWIEYFLTGHFDMGDRHMLIERLEDVLSGLKGGVVIDPQRQSDPRFNGDQIRQRHWYALADDMQHPCLEDRPG